MLFKRKKSTITTEEKESVAAENFYEEVNMEGLEPAYKADREYIDIESPSLYIDVIEMLHFFNELPSRWSQDLIERNERAIDYFRRFTSVYVGNAFEFYQTVVFFYYKHWHDKDYPFQSSQLEFVFEKVAKNMMESVDYAVQEENLAVTQIRDAHARSFYFHEDRCEMHATRFMRNMTVLIPQYDIQSQLMAEERQFVDIANDTYEDIRSFLYKYEHEEFVGYDSIYKLIGMNDELITMERYIPIIGLKYLPIHDESIVYVMAQMRVYRFQNILVQGLNHELSTQLSLVKTVKAVEQYLLSENSKYFSQTKEKYYANNQFITLFFDSYCFEYGITSDADSPKVRSCLQQLVKAYKRECAENPTTLIDLAMLIKKAYYEHQLMAGN